MLLSVSVLNYFAIVPLMFNCHVIFPFLSFKSSNFRHSNCAINALCSLFFLSLPHILQAVAHIASLRLVKNREAAQLFRQRQKAYIRDLEKKVTDLTAAINESRARVELLNSENKLIKEQLLYLRNFITQAVSFSLPKGTQPGTNPMLSFGMPGFASLALGNMGGNVLNVLSPASNPCQSSMAASSCSGTSTQSTSQGMIPVPQHLMANSLGDSGTFARATTTTVRK